MGGEQQPSNSITPLSSMASLSDRAPKVGARVKLKDKDLLGQVVYVGLTEFAAGKWIGVVLDEPKGKNNGIVQGKEYFRCKEKHGKSATMIFPVPLYGHLHVLLDLFHASVLFFTP